MLDIKRIRNNPEEIVEALKKEEENILFKNFWILMKKDVKLFKK